MLIGLSVVLFAVYFIITGTYENIQAREAAESSLNLMGLGGMLYLVAFWYMSVFKHEIFFSKPTKK
jgi:hypothetical protein